jgi:hypothetical protein
MIRALPLLLGSCFLHNDDEAKLVECLRNVGDIVKAERAYRAAFDTLRAAEAAPRPLPDRRAVAWSPSPGFEALGWAPMGKVYGVYTVTLSADGAQATVTSRCDVDGDGEVAIFEQTTDELHPRRLTPNDVY